MVPRHNSLKKFSKPNMIFFKKNKKETEILLRGMCIAFAVSLVFFFGFLEKVERWGLNTQFHLRGAIPPKSPIVIVSIDEDSFDELELQWPWPRSLHAQFVDTISQGQPAAVGFDILFAEPSALGPDDDQALGEAIGRAGNIVLAAAVSVVDGRFYRKENLNPPIHTIRKKSVGYGPVNLVLENDAFVRRAQLTLDYQDKVLLGFDVLLYQTAQHIGLPPLTYSDPNFFINFRGGPRTFELIPYYRVLNGEIPPAYFHDKIVLVGATSPLLHDVYPTPFATQGTMPGVEIHANILETMIQGIPISRIHPGIPVLCILFGGVLAVWVTRQVRPLRALSILLGVAGIYTLIAFALFTQFRVWVDLMPLPFALTLGYGASLIENFIREQREKKRLSHYFSPDVLTDIIRHRSEATLGSSRRVVTILFSDIRGFTTMSEKMEAEEVVAFLREYLTEMTDAVFQHGGTVDKYIGDAIMALYNVPLDQPNHALQAVRTALEFQRRLKPLAEKFRKTQGRDLACGVGIHTGEAVVGTMGSAQRFEYTAIGDTINLGARLESITKEYKTPIVISESTYLQVKDHCLTRYLDEVKVKGKEISVKIYAVLEGNTRAEKRESLSGEVTVGLNGTTEKNLIQDITTQGIALGQLQASFGCGDMIQLNIQLPTLVRPLEIQGKVMWKSAKNIGVLFIDPKPEDGQSIGEAIRRQGEKSEPKSQN